MSILIRNAKILFPQSVFNGTIKDIWIENGIIKNIATEINTENKRIIEGNNLHLSAGWVDLFADYCEPGFEQNETLDSGLKTAIAGGFTDVGLIPNTYPTISNKSIVEYVQRKATNNIVNLHVLGSISQHIEGLQLAEMLDMEQQGAKGFTDGWKPLQNPNLFLKALEYVKAFDGTLFQIPVEVSLSEGGLMNEGVVSTHLGLAGIPEFAESIAVYKAIELLRYTQSKLHLTGISTTHSVALIRNAKLEGLNLTCSVTPYHLVLTDEALTTYNSFYKVAPPLRTQQNIDALIEGLNDGTIDAIASHHHPQNWDAKTKEFEYAAHGINMQQFVFPVLWKALENKISIEKLIEKLTVSARTLLNLKTPQLDIGQPAQLTVFSTEITPSRQSSFSLSQNNPFTEKDWKGSVIAVFNNHQININ